MVDKSQLCVEYKINVLMRPTNGTILKNTAAQPHSKFSHEFKFSQSLVKTS